MRFKVNLLRVGLFIIILLVLFDRLIYVKGLNCLILHHRLG
jgi:hypothetical protein